MEYSDFQIIIPARKGSKRFPGKNMVSLRNKPLIQYTIEFALSEGFSSEQIWVNSDDDQILYLADSLGVRTYSRSDALAEDHTPTVAVLVDQLTYFKANRIPCESVILLQVTNPLRPQSLLKHSLQRYMESSRSSLCTFSRLNKKFGTIKEQLYLPKNYKPGQRMQDLEALFYENGLLYISSSDLILNENKIIGEDVFPLVIDHVFAQVDIDEPEDLLLAEFLIERTKS